MMPAGLYRVWRQNSDLDPPTRSSAPSLIFSMVRSARWQLLARGLTRHEIDGADQGRSPRPVHRGVYLVGHIATAPLAYEAAAILAFRGKATISHRSAAKLLGSSLGRPKRLAG